MFSEALLQLYAEPVRPSSPSLHGDPSLNVSHDQHPDDENTDPSHVFPSTLANTTKKRRKPTDIIEMADSSFSCCKSLRCVEAFIKGTADVRELRAEQKAFSALVAGRSRAEFVNSMIPASHPGKNKGAMRAGGRVVCNTFFKEAFGVSNNLIQNQKHNARAPTIATRYDTCSD